eukprot:NODE_18874_length_871_cov_2.047043.p1 GENE.NODE_18874_length_871_cov_2.047043~~NODE_18874_length_871_cov_2.047043.p1  ORF type:complete len:185 (-),score=38.79 NODE_18874_length_871_cov_2.047043:119-673(-)
MGHHLMKCEQDTACDTTAATACAEVCWTGNVPGEYDKQDDPLPVEPLPLTFYSGAHENPTDQMVMQLEHRVAELNSQNQQLHDQKVRLDELQAQLDAQTDALRDVEEETKETFRNAEMEVTGNSGGKARNRSIATKEPSSPSLTPGGAPANKARRHGKPASAGMSAVEVTTQPAEDTVSSGGGQ